MPKKKVQALQWIKEGDDQNEVQEENEGTSMQRINLTKRVKIRLKFEEENEGPNMQRIS